MGLIALLSLLDSFPYSAQAGCPQPHLSASQDPAWQDGSHYLDLGSTRLPMMEQTALVK